MMIGYRQGTIHDEARRNWDDSGARPIHWSVWYPAAPSDDDSGAVISDFFRTGRLLADAQVEKSDVKRPLILLSHGTGGSAIGLSWLAEALANCGCIVIGANHHGNTSLEEYRAEGFLCWWERPRDLTVLLDHIVASPLFGSHVDETRIAAAGFSLGGYSVVSLLGATTRMELFSGWSSAHPLGGGPQEFPDLSAQIDRLLSDSAVFRASWERQSYSYLDQRIARGAALAPAPTVRGFDEASLAAITTPVVLIVGGEDREAPAEDCALWLHERMPASKLYMLADRVGHYTFLSPGDGHDARGVSAPFCRSSVRRSAEGSSAGDRCRHTRLLPVAGLNEKGRPCEPPFPCSEPDGPDEDPTGLTSCPCRPFRPCRPALQAHPSSAVLRSWLPS